MHHAQCRHCGQESEPGQEFCCPGCRGAYVLVGDLGLASYYAKRCLDGSTDFTALRPDEMAAQGDLSAWIRPAPEGRLSLTLMVDGLSCGACVWLIEQSLLRQPGVVSARVSLSTRRLNLVWQAGMADPAQLAGLVQRLGYRLLPCDPARLASAEEKQARELLRCLAVAGFAAGNIMLLSVSVWSGHAADMAAGTRDLLHWISGLIALPAIAYAGRPFFRSAWHALRAGRTNMDVPISLAVILAPGVSLVETFQSGPHAYFDSAVTLLFFLLIGRYLDHRARYRARALGEQLLALNAVAATVLEADGTRRDIPPTALRPGMVLLVGAGQRIPADGIVTEGASEIDTSTVTGETLPRGITAGGQVYAGTLNLSAPIRLRVAAAGEATLLADIIRLMEAAETRRGRFVQLADRVARHYAPVVHVTALAAFLGWWLLGGMAWQDALMIAVAVLIITCPCALALAVPVVQVVASQRLMRSGVLLKSGDALERLQSINHVVFDKTGTLTLGRLTLVNDPPARLLRLAAGIAANSRHPLARALAQAATAAPVLSPVEECPGQGMIWHGPEGDWRLGSARFAGEPDDGTQMAVLWLVGPRGEKVRFDLADELRPDAADTIAQLKARGLAIEICSGDRAAPVTAIASRLGIDTSHAQMDPAAKVRHLQSLAAQGRRVLMIGDGINDAAALAAAHVSMAPASGAEISQSAADIVFQGERLAPISLALTTARRSHNLMRQNLMLALCYNLAAVPLAVLGFVTPLLAAIAMSSSSILVILNSLRLGHSTRPEGGIQ
ncbi:MAG: cadmium-translocating P-type ATPase [Rhodospirillaceae bacterium]|nr:cadmium-translocating P-type ATPase [Rhodospirillaceae bacterium]